MPICLSCVVVKSSHRLDVCPSRLKCVMSVLLRKKVSGFYPRSVRFSLDLS